MQEKNMGHICPIGCSRVNDADLDVTSYKFKLKIIVLKSDSKLFKLPIILW